jgi:predicted ATP-grasp superfamily ATP-dependent carboligase
VRVFVSEFVAGGALAGTLPELSMRREGLSMLRAVTADIARLPGCSVVTTLERGLLATLPGEVILIEDPVQESDVFDRLLGQVDAVLVIAPETGGVLAERCRRVNASGVISWNCTPAAIELCGDKLGLAEHLESHGLPTIPTQLANFSRPPASFAWPVVLKPRDGAGSCLTFLVRDAGEWKRVVELVQSAGTAGQCLVQPFVVGQALSIGVNIPLDGLRTECLLVGEQHLSADGRFHYQGGTIPAAIPAAAVVAIRNLVHATCQTIPGLAGYIGLDLVLTDQDGPVIVEINPRLTTAYVGYRQLCSGTLPARWLSDGDLVTPLTWQPGSIRFGTTLGDGPDCLPG